MLNLYYGAAHTSIALASGSIRNLPRWLDENDSEQRSAGTEESPMGDKSPRSKQRKQKQDRATKARAAVDAKSKQDGYTRPVIPKGKK